MLREEQIKELSLAVAQALQNEREAAKLSKNALAQKAGVAVQTIAFIESGVNSPSLTTLIRICEALETSVDAIYQKAVEGIDGSQDHRVADQDDTTHGSMESS